MNHEHHEVTGYLAYLDALNFRANQEFTAWKFRRAEERAVR